MKSPRIILFLLFSCLASFAQSGFLFQPQIGFGVSKMSGIDVAPIACDCGINAGPQKSVTTFDAEAKIGYRLDHFRFNTGLQWLRTGSLQNSQYESFPGGKTYSSPVQDKYSHYDHLLVPISFGFNIPVKKKWSVTPELGTRLAFLSQNDHSLSNANGFLFSGRFNVEYGYTEHFSFVLSPAYYYMITPLYNNVSMPLGIRGVNDVCMLQVGVQWHFCHKPKIKAGKKIGFSNK